MKKIGRTLFIVLLLFAVASTALAHPGRTDGSGGHYNRSTGEYHYHHGYPEHDHYDVDGDGDIDCPYDFKNNESPSGSSSSTSSTGSNWISGKGNPNSNDERIKDEHINTEIIETEVSYTFWNRYGLYVIPAAVLLAILIYISLVLHKQKVQKQRELDEKIFKIKKKIADEDLLHKRTVSSRIFCYLLNDEYNKLCKRQSAIIELKKNCISHPTERVVLPRDTSVDVFGDPYCPGLTQKDDPYIFSLSDSGMYHRTSCRYANAYKYINAADLVYKKNRVSLRNKQIRACSICNPILPELSWLPNYNEINRNILFLNSITANKRDKFWVYQDPVKAYPYNTIISFLYEENMDKAIELAKKMVGWFELNDAEAVLRFMLVRTPKPSPVLIKAFEILCQNYEEWDTQRIKLLEQKERSKLGE